VTTIISQHNPKSNFDDKQIQLAVEAQGGFFAVAFRGEHTKSTLKSIADDLKLQRKHTARITKNYQKDFSFEEAFGVSACTRPGQDTRTEQDDEYYPVISPEARAQIAREAHFATLRDLHSTQKRRAIADFSRKSRLRLLKLVSRLEKTASGLFLTFTYRANMQDHTDAKKHLDLLLRWLKYHHPEGAFLWRMEYQKRGAIHFHVIAFNVRRIEIQSLTQYWQELTGDNSYPDIETMHNRRRALYYVSKYVAKHESNNPSGFISEPYSEKPAFFGRFWGVVNRKLLPFAARSLIFLQGDAKAFHDLRRYARRHYKRLSGRLQGFTLLVGDAQQWLDLLWRTERDNDRWMAWVEPAQTQTT